ncbi:CAP domain-containing protein [Xanthobacter autotrophicus DSM 431]|uniref:CAP domain-containing protein n=1 Tax=Xanthobacter nonsaccharivorans TaxID=3119912 RepID=UPI00372CDB03
MRHPILRRSLLTGAGLGLVLFLAGCGTTDTQLDSQPAFYTNLAKTGKPVDAAAAASILTDYRTARGLSAVAVDEQLNKIAQDQANAMARADNLSHEVGGRGFMSRMKASGYDASKAVENVGAGYHTLAEAFSGWRDSPSHNKNMLEPGVTRVGIATANAPNSKYKVYWALVLAEPDKSGR